MISATISLINDTSLITNKIFVGLTDRMRSDFNLMRAVAEHTRINPQGRIDRLRKFNSTLAQNAQVADVFRTWNFRLDQNLVQIDGRVLNVPRMKVGGNQYQEVKNGDWNFAFPKNKQLCPCKLKDWILLLPSRMRDDGKVSIYYLFIF